MEHMLEYPISTVVIIALLGVSSLVLVGVLLYFITDQLVVIGYFGLLVGNLVLGIGRIGKIVIGIMD
jgi:hypothetical protein